MMQASLSIGALRAAMTTVGRAVDLRSSIPILGMFRLSVADGQMTVCGADLDMMLSVTLPVAGAVDGAICVTARIIRFLRALPNFETITLREVADRRFVVDLPDGRISLIGVDPVGFPDAKPVVPDIDFTMSGSELLAAIGRVAGFISDEETRYYLNGIYLHATEPGEIVLVATNGHTLGRLRLPFNGDFPRVGFIVPKGAIDCLIKTLPRDASIKIGLSKQGVMFSSEDGSFELSSKLIDGTFPNYTRVIPQTAKSQFEVSPSAWCAKLGRIIAFAFNAPAYMTLARDAAGKTTASMRHYDFGEIGVALASAHIAGDEAFSIGFDARVLAKAMAPHAAEKLTISFIDGGAPAKLESADFLSVAMPARVDEKSIELPEGCEP